MILSKQFTPLRETQITVGRAGVSSRQSAGEYAFQCQVPGENGRIYKLVVDPLVYNSHATGDHFYFVLPPTPAASAPPPR